MTHHEKNRLLIDAGFAKTTKEANALRGRIEETSTVEAYIAANPKSVDLGVKPLASDAVGMGEIRALMHQEGISFGTASLLRNQIQSAGGTVADYIGAEASPVDFGEGGTPSTLSVFRAAQGLIKLAGSPEKATKAIELFAGFEKAKK